MDKTYEYRQRSLVTRYCVQLGYQRRAVEEGVRVGVPRRALNSGPSLGRGGPELATVGDHHFS